MADIKNRDAEPGIDQHLPREEAVREGIELLFFAYRDFTAEPDAILVQYGFGRAHHRVVHFVGRHPRQRWSGEGGHAVCPLAPTLSPGGGEGVFLYSAPR